MEKLKAIFFLIIYLLSATECTQVLKLPILVTHYTEHIEKKVNHTFSEFLNDHYLSDDGEPNDDESDSRLPFKKLGVTELDADTLIVIGSISFGVSSRAILMFIADAESLLPSRDVSGIWLPPKVG